MTEQAHTFPAEEDYGLNVSLVDAVLETVKQGSQQQLLSLLEPLHEADIADILEQISPSERVAMLTLWGKEIDGEVLSELEEGVRDEVMRDLPDDVLAEAVRDLETDDVVYLVEDLDEPQQEKLLEKLDDVDRLAVEQALTYEEDSAGRLMQREVVVAPEHWTVGDIIDYMRNAENLPENFYDVVVVDPKMRPVGEVRLATIMGTAREVPLSDLMEKDFRTIPVDQDIEHVAYAFNQYHMVSAPVVNPDGRLVGVITIDDAMEVLEDEVEEDMNRLAGVGDEDLTDTVWQIVRARFPWLSVTLVSSILSATVISQFTDAIGQIVALAVLMPIVASMGGNAGTQTLTVAVRALATRDLTSANAVRIVWREVRVGFLNGVLFAIIIGAAGGLWFQNAMLGAVLAMAMVTNMLVAGLAGILVPITLDKLGADPALASGAFVTTVTDIVGFFSFLGLAALLLL